MRNTVGEIPIRGETADQLARRARLMGQTPGEYAAQILERVLDGFEVRDSAERTFHRRLEEIAPLAR